MANIGILLPYENMTAIVQQVIEKNHYDIDYIKAIQSENAIKEARLAARHGVDILIARGYQAQLIKAYTHIPVVEMRFHAQEIGLLIRRAKQMVHKERVTIGVAAFENMLCDLSHMEELFDVKLLVSYITRIEEVPDLVRHMKQDGADCIIGGDTVNREAERMGCLSLTFTATAESVQDAIERAKDMAYAVENEKRNAAQLETALDTTFNGMLKVNDEGRILVANRLIENLIGKKAEDIKGELLYDIFPQIEKRIVDDILAGKRENHLSSVEIRSQSWMMLAAPISFDGQITGAILSFHTVTELVQKNRQPSDEMRRYGYTAETGFRDIETQDEQMCSVLELAKEYSLSDSPVLIYGNIGTEEQQIAEAIHNNSIRKGGPFVSVDIGCVEWERQSEMLFGGGAENRDKGVLGSAGYGTVFIRGIEKLSLEAQYRLARVITQNEKNRTDILLTEYMDVRIIAAAGENLRYLMKKGLFDETLYYLLHGLTLEIPPLGSRREDLRRCAEQYFRSFCQKYHKHLAITKDGYERLLQLQWQGNMLQLRAFMERLVITAKKRSISEGAICSLYETLYPYVGREGGAEKVVVYKTQEEAKVREALEKHHGNRKLAAQELGISTTTLWRKMNRYGIASQYGDE